MNNQKFPFRIVPWFTDDCSTFLNHLFKWLPQTLNKRLSVLEFGGGNSTLYFLSKGLQVITVESDLQFVDFLATVAQKAGFSAQIFQHFDDFLAKENTLDLAILVAQQLSDLPDIISKVHTDLISSDGISRREVLAEIMRIKPNAIVVLDNVDYAANWGRLTRSSGKPDLIEVYRAFLRSPDWQRYIFEQPEGREGASAADKTGKEMPMRWMSAVAWPREHLLSELMISHLGLPVVNVLGVNNADLETLSERCPFDWDKMQWLCEVYPEALDLKLPRSFD